MKKLKMNQGKRYLFAFLILALAVVFYIILFMKVWNDRHGELNLDVNSGAATKEVDVWVTVTKSWEDKDEQGKDCIGAQYDGYVENHMDAVLMDWTLYIALPKEARIDSSWNGEYTNEGNQIVFVPEEELDIAWVVPGAKENFGFILYSDELLEITEFHIVGHKYAEITSYAWFYLATFLLIAGVVVFLWEVAFAYRTRQLEQRRMNDEKIIVETMLTLANFIDAKDEYTKGHSLRVSNYAVMLAKRMHLPEESIRSIGYIALMHDCGKIAIPDEVLNKPDELTKEEFELVQLHTTYGGKMLENMTAIKGIKEGALYHHERYDGTGYPEGLAGEEIPLHARIIGVADAYDAMNSDRCYRKRLPMELIRHELRKNAGKQFDPEIVKYMIRLIDEGSV